MTNSKLPKTIPHLRRYTDGSTFVFGEPVNLVGDLRDAFGRVRVSDTENIISFQQNIDDAEYLINTETSGSGISTYSKARSSSLFTVSSSDSYVIRQTYERTPYIPGNSLVLDFSFANFENEENVVKRVGYFTAGFDTPFSSSFDGLFLESNPEDGYTLNIWNSGSVVQRVPQAEWNVDPLDGNGISGFSASFENNQILSIDLQALYVGRVRWHFFYEGIKRCVHESDFTNVRQGAYIQSANKPLRWELRQTGPGSGSFEQICAASQLEGKITGVTKDISVNFGSTELTLSTADRRYLLAAVRASRGNEDVRILDTALNFLSTTNDIFLYEVILNPTFTNGTPVWVEVPYTKGEAALGDATILVEGGITMQSGYFLSDVEVRANFGYDAVRFGTAIDGTRDIITIAITPLSANSKLLYAATSKILQ